MNKGWIKDWKKKVGKKPIRLHGSTSTSKNLDVALTFSKCKTDFESDQQPVLFVYSIQNYDGFRGFRLNDKRYTVYPSEQEYLLMEGIRVFVLNVGKEFKISNKFLPEYHSKSITIICLQDNIWSI